MLNNDRELNLLPAVESIFSTLSKFEVHCLQKQFPCFQIGRRYRYILQINNVWFGESVLFHMNSAIHHLHLTHYSWALKLFTIFLIHSIAEPVVILLLPMFTFIVWLKIPNLILVRLHHNVYQV